MNRYVALIRGINVGRAKRVAMADLRKMVADLGYDDVRTLLNSGNVVFTIPKTGGDGQTAATRIQEGLETTLGVTARVLVVSAEEFRAVVVGNPFEAVADDPSRYLVSFLNDPADLARLASLTTQDWSPEAIAVGTRVAYLWCAEGILDGNLAPAVSRLLGDAATTRNWATVMKLLALLNVD